MNIGQISVTEMMIWIGVSLLAFIASLLLILMRMVKKLISLLQDIKTIQPVTERQLIQNAVTAVPEEDLVVIMAVLAKILPGVNPAAIQIKSV
jgi:hypothetical protein